MKKIILYSALLLAGTISATAQLDRSKAPEAGPAPKIQIKQAETFTLKNGLKVFVVENHKIPKVAYSLVLDIPPVSQGDKAGYIGMVGDMLTRGTGTRSKQQLDEEIDFIGADLSASSAGIYASALKKHNETLLTLMADVLMHPSFPEEEFEKLKKQSLSNLASEKNDAGTIATNIRNAYIYGAGHPYADVATDSSISHITLDDIKNYYTTNFMPNIGYLAIVGDITKAEAEVLVEKYFGTWAKGKAPVAKLPTSTPPANPQVVMHNREESQQSTIRFVYPVDLKPGSADAIKVSVLANILGGGSTGRLYRNLRETHGYTYGAYCGFKQDAYMGYFSANADVRTAVTDSAIYEFIREFNLISTKGITPEELAGAKLEMQGDFARALESPQTVAQFAINIARYKLPANYYQDYLINLNAITVEEMNEVAKKYIKPFNYYLVVVGVRDSIQQNILRYDSDQKIAFVDNFGVQVKELREAPVDVTVETVLNNYITAIGGKEKVEAVSDLKITGTATVQGFQLAQTVLLKRPDNLLSVVTAQGQTFQSIQIQKGVGKSTNAITGNKDLTSNEIKDNIAGYDPAFELNYATTYGNTAKLLGIANIGGKDAYLVEFTDGAGTKTKVYYDLKSSLKVREESTEQTPEGPVKTVVSISDYRDVSGVKFAYASIIESGGQVIYGTADSITINNGLTEDMFK